MAQSRNKDKQQNNPLNNDSKISPEQSLSPDLSNNDSLSQLPQKISELKDVCDLLVKTSDDASFGNFCDEYTRSAKEVAAIILSERIRRSFIGKVSENGKSNENLEEKIEHTRQIRDWLAPWNLAPTDPDSKLILACSAGSRDPQNEGKYSSYRLKPYRGQNESRVITKWATIKQILCSPNLVDATDILRKNEKSPGRH